MTFDGHMAYLFCSGVDSNKSNVIRFSFNGIDPVSLKNSEVTL